MCQDVSKSEVLSRGLAAADNATADLAVVTSAAAGGDGDYATIEQGLACLKRIAAELRAALVELEGVTCEQRQAGT